MYRNPLPDLETLHKLVEYDPYSGVLRPRDRSVAGPYKGGGYCFVIIGGTRYLVHRIAYKIMTNTEPHSIDHIDGNGGNNAWNNIRGVTVAENNRNRRIQRNNRTGVTGVSLLPNGRYKAHICFERKRITLGRFDNFEDACAVRKAAERLYGFHENHGK